MVPAGKNVPQGIDNALQIPFLHPCKKRQRKNPLERLFRHGKVSAFVSESALVERHQMQRNKMHARADILASEPFDYVVARDAAGRNPNRVEVPRRLHFRQDGRELQGQPCQAGVIALGKFGATRLEVACLAKLMYPESRGQIRQVLFEASLFEVVLP